MILSKPIPNLIEGYNLAFLKLCKRLYTATKKARKHCTRWIHVRDNTRAIITRGITLECIRTRARASPWPSLHSHDDDDDPDSREQLSPWQSSWLHNTGKPLGHAPQERGSYCRVRHRKCWEPVERDIDFLPLFGCIASFRTRQPSRCPDASVCCQGCGGFGA